MTLSIKGTLETFNLCELLQMLAFNRKVGTLVLEAEGSPRAIYLDTGRAALAQDDPFLRTCLIRIARRHLGGGQTAIDRAASTSEESGRDLAAILHERGMVDADTREAWYREALLDHLFNIQLTSVTGFEFAEEQVLRPDGGESRPIEPAIPVESLLLDLARMLDHWNAISEIVPSSREVYEGTGVAVDLADAGDIDSELAAALIPLIDGRRSLNQIAEACFATPYAVAEIAAALFEGGGLRAVPTDDLIGRAEDLMVAGEAASAVPILQRAIERGDAPLDVRLRLADALEASAQSAMAAAELDTFVALSDDGSAPQVFEALMRSLRLRGGDPATAMRTCDYYLRRRPWLREYRTQATEALRDLIRAATTSGRPLDAAGRLAGFIRAGDAPSEDLLLLADLYEAGGNSFEAASALVRRAEDLLTAERRSQARDLLRRALELEPGHADARRRLLEMEGTSRRRLHKTRMSLLALLTLVVVGGAGAAWWFYRQSATKEVGGAREVAELAVEDTERKARGLIESFKDRLEAAATAADEDQGLAQAAEALKSGVRAHVAASQRALKAYDEEIETYSASGNQERNRIVLKGLEQRRQYLISEASAVIADPAKRAREALLEATRRNTEGNFTEARRFYRKARNLSFLDPQTHGEALKYIEHVDAYFAQFTDYRRRMVAAAQKGDLRAAFSIGRSALRELEDSDLTRGLDFPVEVDSTPPGAAIWIGTRDTGKQTPAVVTYSPFEAETTLRVRMPGRTPATLRLPTFEGIVRAPDTERVWQPLFRATLAPGPRWTVQDTSGGFTAYWSHGDVPIVVSARGRVVNGLDPRDGSLLPGGRVDVRNDPIRMGGVGGGGIQWRVHGQRTVAVQPPNAPGWSMRTIGRVEHPPLVAAGLFVVVDMVGTVYAYDAESGERGWRIELGSPPSQPPLASRLGVLLATIDGSTYRVPPGTDTQQRLVPSVKGLALALPFGGGAVVIGQGTDGVRSIGPDGQVRTIAAAGPLASRVFLACPEGVAWVEQDGVRWLGMRTDRPIRVPGLGSTPHHLCAGKDRLLAVDGQGVLRAVPLDPSDGGAFALSLGAPPEAAPVLVERVLYVLTPDGLVAVEF